MVRDCIIIGGGPAGVSAALYTAPYFDTLIISKGAGALKNAEKIMNYYGFPDGISGADLQARGYEQAAKSGAEILEDEVFSIAKETDYFLLVCKKETYKARTVIIAAGANRVAPPKIGIEHFEGAGVSYCAICDGFFFRDKKVAVLGSGEYARHEIKELQNFTKNVVLLTNGESSPISPEAIDFKIDTRKIKTLIGENRLSGIVFEDGFEMPIDGVFVAQGSASSVDFARKTGVVTEKNLIVVDKNGETNIKGLYAAGDCVSELKQISVTVGTAAVAGRSVVNYLRKILHKGN